jgi:hypothetical protein
MELWCDMTDHAYELNKMENNNKQNPESSMTENKKYSKLINTYIDTYNTIDSLMEEHVKTYFNKYKTLYKSVIVDNIKLNKFNIINLEKHIHSKYLIDMI